MPGHVNYDDLVSCGQFGLLDSIEKYDPARKIKFDTYAKSRIHGAILDDSASGTGFPRTVRQRHRQIEQAGDRLHEVLGREATDKEIADYTGLEYEIVRKTRMEHHEGLITSLDESAGDDESGGVTRRDTVADETSERPWLQPIEMQ